jgi:uncharacterized protein
MWPARLLIFVVKAYRLLFSPWVGSACRFSPSCSAYSVQALEEYGATSGTYLTLGRLARCHPWCEGGEDPVPQQAPRLFARLFPAGRRGAESTSAHNMRKPHP